MSCFSLPLVIGWPGMGSALSSVMNENDGPSEVAMKPVIAYVPAATKRVLDRWQARSMAICKGQ